MLVKSKMFENFFLKSLVTCYTIWKEIYFQSSSISWEFISIFGIFTQILSMRQIFPFHVSLIWIFFDRNPLIFFPLKNCFSKIHKAKSSLQHYLLSLKNGRNFPFGKSLAKNDPKKTHHFMILCVLSWLLKHSTDTMIEKWISNVPQSKSPTCNENNSDSCYVVGGFVNFRTRHNVYDRAGNFNEILLWNLGQWIRKNSETTDSVLSLCALNQRKIFYETYITLCYF